MMWDFWSPSPESLQQVTILFSDRGTPRSQQSQNFSGPAPLIKRSLKTQFFSLFREQAYTVSFFKTQFFSLFKERAQSRLEPLGPHASLRASAVPTCKPANVPTTLGGRTHPRAI